MRLDEIDKNYKEEMLCDGLSFFDPRTSAAIIYGLLSPQDYCRFSPKLRSASEETDPGVLQLAWCPSGGRIRFCTDSTRLGVQMKLRDSCGMPHMPNSGCSGLDFFSGTGRMRYLGTRRPETGSDKVETEVELPGGMKQVTVYLPLYNAVESLLLGVEPGSRVEAPAPYSQESPVVFYGSSITQGGCASRTSNSYCALLARWLDVDFMDMGFSGGARGQLWLAEEIASWRMSCFVYDYDHNAPDADFLERTHQPFLRTILEKQPELPVLLLSKPYPNLSGEDAHRREIIKETCAWAVRSGYRAQFVDGEVLLGSRDQDACTVDGVHPNDLGFYRMAETLLGPLAEFLGT